VPATGGGFSLFPTAVPPSLFPCPRPHGLARAPFLHAFSTLSNAVVKYTPFQSQHFPHMSARGWIGKHFVLCTTTLLFLSFQQLSVLLWSCELPPWRFRVFPYSSSDQPEPREIFPAACIFSSQGMFGPRGLSFSNFSKRRFEVFKCGRGVFLSLRPHLMPFARSWPWLAALFLKCRAALQRNKPDHVPFFKKIATSLSTFLFEGLKESPSPCHRLRVFSVLRRRCPHAFLGAFLYRPPCLDYPPRLLRAGRRFSSDMVGSSAFPPRPLPPDFFVA